MKKKKRTQTNNRIHSVTFRVKETQAWRNSLFESNGEDGSQIKASKEKA